MPCNSIVVVQGKVRPEVAAEILASDKALEGLRRHIAAQTGTAATLETYGTDERALIRAGAISVYITAARGIEVRGSALSTGRMALQNLTAGIEAAAGRMAVALATDKAVGMLRQRYVVKSDQTLANGTRVLRLSI